MVSSDFGKLDAMRQCTVGWDCASAGTEVSPAASPAPAFCMKRRRSIADSPCLFSINGPARSRETQKRYSCDTVSTSPFNTGRARGEGHCPTGEARKATIQGANHHEDLG